MQLAPTDLRRSCHMTENGVTLYVYVTIYAAVHCGSKSGCAYRLHPALLIAVSSHARYYATEKRDRKVNTPLA